MNSNTPNNPGLQITQGPWLDSQDIMLMLHVSKSTLRRWRQKGKLPFTQILGKIWYHRQDLEAMMAKYKFKRSSRRKRNR